MLNLAEVIVGFGLGIAPPPSPPVPSSPPPETSQAVAIGRRVLQLTFNRITPTSLPRGSNLRSVVMQVTPHSGRNGALVAAISAALDCGNGPSNFSSSTIEWDIQPYDMGFEIDQTPDLAPLLEEAILSRDPASLQDCAVKVRVERRDGDGQRYVYAPFQANVARRPRLELTYDAPTTAAQLQWTPDRDCDVTVAVPVPVASETCTPANAASGLPLESTDTCPHLQLTATAATSDESCKMEVNGVDLFAGCGLDRLVVGRDGVCVAQLDLSGQLNGQPRAACFDTQTAGVGNEQLASWIDNLQTGSTAMVVSCSRFAWRHNRQRMATVLASLGARTPPQYTDDAYALIGIKTATAPLAESRQSCCENPDPVCLTCDQTPAIAIVQMACASSIGSSASTSVLGAESYFGGFGSESHMSAVGAIQPPLVAIVTSVPSSAASGIATFQAADSDVLDAVCETPLATATRDPYGVHLATDGDPSTYWLSSGAPDAVFTIDFGATRRLTNLTLDWEAPAYSLLVLYSAATAGDDWRVGGTINDLEALYATPPRSPTSTVALSDGSANAAVGVSARRLRLYMADAANATRPVFALRELNVSSCALVEEAITLPTRLSYEGARTPTVTSIAPRRGSTAGGTRITLNVDGLPAGTGVDDVAVTVVGLPCAITSVAGSEVVCLTASHGRTTAANPGNGPVLLTLPAIGSAAATANATYEYIDLWSRYTTWGGEYVGGVRNRIPGLETTGDSVWIQTGQRLLLDCDIDVYELPSPPPLATALHTSYLAHLPWNVECPPINPSVGATWQVHAHRPGGARV